MGTPPFLAAQDTQVYFSCRKLNESLRLAHSPVHSASQPPSQEKSQDNGPAWASEEETRFSRDECLPRATKSPGPSLLGAQVPLDPTICALRPPRSQAHGRRCTSDDPIHPSATPTRGAASFLFAPGFGPGSPDSPQTRRRFLLSLQRGFPASREPLRAPAPLTLRPIPHRSLSR